MKPYHKIAITAGIGLLGLLGTQKTYSQNTFEKEKVVSVIETTKQNTHTTLKYIDYEGDGDIDIIKTRSWNKRLNERVSNEIKTYLHRNNNGKYAKKVLLNYIQLARMDINVKIDYVDYDGDGDIDQIITKENILNTNRSPYTEIKTYLFENKEIKKWNNIKKWNS